MDQLGFLAERRRVRQESQRNQENQENQRNQENPDVKCDKSESIV